jgi:hypothetical protein
MKEIFAAAQGGLNTIIFFLVLIGISSIGARLVVRYMMRNSGRSRESKRAMENLAAVVVTGIIGMIMISVLGKIK